VKRSILTLTFIFVLVCSASAQTLQSATILEAHEFSAPVANGKGLASISFNFQIPESTAAQLRFEYVAIYNSSNANSSLTKILILLNDVAVLNEQLTPGRKNYKTTAGFEPANVTQFSGEILLEGTGNSTFCGTVNLYVDYVPTPKPPEEQDYWSWVAVGAMGFVVVVFFIALKRRKKA